MTMMTSTFRIHALPEAELARIRTAGHDDFGNRLAVHAVEDGEAPSPLRCCLRRTRAGDRIALIAWRPAGGLGAYAEVGPVFIHADPCDGYADVAEYPQDYRDRHQVLRGYDARGRIAAAVVTDGDQAESAIQGLLARPDVVVIHSRNVTYGCYMFTVTRTGTAPAA